MIFQPYKTGFEENKDFAPETGAVVAGRYQINRVLGEVYYLILLVILLNYNILNRLPLALQ